MHIRFCKPIPNVKLSTSNAGIYGEFGRYPLYINQYIRIVKYLLKIVNTNNCILSTVYKCSLQLCNLGKPCWATNVKHILCNYGYGNVCENPNGIDRTVFYVVLKEN